MTSEEKQFKYCTDCGAKNAKSAKFCKQCGTPFASNQSQATTHSERESHEENRSSIMGSATAKLNSWTGGHGEVKISLRNFFSEVFKKHTQTEAEEIFIVGTPKTTPSIEDVSVQEVHPWLFSRIFAFAILLVILMYVLTTANGRPGMFIALTSVAAVVIPVSSLILFFEINVLQNISFYKTVQMSFFGGVLSMLLVMSLDAVIPSGTGNILASFGTGFTEELSKVLIAAYFVNQVRARGILNGLLIGSAVGAGFAAIENIIYSVNDETGTLLPLSSDIFRTVTSMGTHTEWCAISTVGLIIACAGKKLTFGDLLNIKFLRFFAVAVILHTIWDSGILSSQDGTLTLPEIIKYTSLIAIVWIVILVLIHAGLRGISELKRAKIGQKNVEKI
ncbi:PrsW family glutamic-type intramembrane protease [Ligilactobacillus saerimneri]|uniref:PrsW family glutamic-type intramembrane protease n=1 Tax=Ligilactobacillus saerimneri TaxID=228229 RepID=UPI003F285E5F